MDTSFFKKITWYYLAFAFFCIATSFFWKTINPLKPASYIVDFFIVSLPIYFVVSFCAGKIKSLSVPVAFLFLLVLIFYSYTNDIENINSNVYLKTFISILSSFALGFFIYAENTDNKNFYSFFCNIILKLSVLINVLVLLLFYKAGWDFKSSLLKIEGIGELYQGLGRLLGVLSLFYVVANSRNGLFYLPLIIVNIIVCVSFASVGSLLAFPIIAFFLVRKTKIFGTFLLLSCVCLVAILFSQVDDLFASAERLIWRIQGKIEFDGDESGSRLGLMALAFDLWTEDEVSFIFGVGVWNYSCEVYECTYRHAHNIFMNLIVFFGLLGLFLSFLILFITSYVVFMKSKSDDLFRFVYIYWFGLAMIGGDLDQNRGFFIVVFYFLLTIIYRRSKI